MSTHLTLVRGNLGTVTSMISQREDVLAKYDRWREEITPDDLVRFRSNYDFESDFHIPTSVQLSIDVDEEGSMNICVDEWNSPRFSFEDDLLNNWLQTLSGAPDEIVRELCGEIASRNNEWKSRAVWSYQISSHSISEVLREFQVSEISELINVLNEQLGDGSESDQKSQRTHQALFKLGIFPQFFDTTLDVLCDSIQESENLGTSSMLEHLYGNDFVRDNGVQEPANLEIGYY